MFCKICRKRASIYIRHHNLPLCKDDFVERFVKETEKNIRKFRMFSRGDRILVAVSGGKDSLALWYVLHELGQNTVGLYINLGIEHEKGEEGYSNLSEKYCRKMAERLGCELIVESALEIASMPAPLISKQRSPCSACGLFKRYVMNKVAKDRGFSVIATGHNVDDETATLLSNVLRWEDGFLARQDVVLEAEEGFVKKVRPFAFFTEKEDLAFCKFEGIEFLHRDCPYSEDATSIFLKEIMGKVETRMPGTKLRFYKEFLRFKKKLKRKIPPLHPCKTCGQPTTGEFCAFCKMLRSAR